MASTKVKAVVIKGVNVKEKDKILLVGYGGGLNLGSILIEI